LQQKNKNILKKIVSLMMTEEKQGGDNLQKAISFIEKPGILL